MDFSKSLPSIRAFPPKKIELTDEPAGGEMLITQPVLGPAESNRPAAPNPLDVHMPPSLDLASLAAALNWELP